MKSKKLISLLTITALGKPASLMALQTYPLVDHQKTELTISKTELNRIAISGDRIQQVFGAEGLFDVQTDDEGGQIFLKLNQGFGALESKSMTITLITEDGLTQDLKLVPQAIDSQSILLKPSLHVEASTYTNASVENPLQEILTLMKAMVRNEDLNGFTKTPCEALANAETLPNIEQTCLTSYLGEKLEGSRYTLVNKGETPLQLKEEDFANPDFLALTFSKSTIHPQEQVTFYVISRRPL
jgi:type-F conjugative transfer system secretin TraK